MVTPYYDTAEYKALASERDALFHAPYGLPANRPEIRLIDQKIADGRWHHENPGKTGSWRIAIGGRVEFSADLPRFETEADALAYIAAHQTYGRATAVFLRSRQTIEADLRTVGIYPERKAVSYPAVDTTVRREDLPRFELGRAA